MKYHYAASHSIVPENVLYNLNRIVEPHWLPYASIQLTARPDPDLANLAQICQTWPRSERPGPNLADLTHPYLGQAWLRSSRPDPNLADLTHIWQTWPRSDRPDLFEGITHILIKKITLPRIRRSCPWCRRHPKPPYCCHRQSRISRRASDGLWLRTWGPRFCRQGPPIEGHISRSDHLINRHIILHRSALAVLLDRDTRKLRLGRPCARMVRPGPWGKDGATLLVKG